MASWREIEAEVPELARRAKAILDQNKHKTIATLRKDGSPRISGIELEFRDGEVYMGSMWKAVKALDLRRDPRFAVHSTSDGENFEADAKFAGTVEEITDPERVAKSNGEGSPEGRSHLFRCEIEELVVTGLNPERTKLVITSWHPGRGVETRER